MKKRVLKIKPTMFMRLKPGETKEDAEDRLLSTLEDVGIDIIGWNDDDETIDEWEDDDG